MQPRKSRPAFPPPDHSCLRSVLGAVLGLCFLTGLAAAERPPQVGATLAFTTAAGPDGAFRVATLLTVKPRRSQNADDAYLVQRLDEILASSTEDRRTLPHFVVPASFKEWLRDQLLAAGFASPIVTDRPGNWTVAATLLRPPYAGVRIEMPTSALAAKDEVRVASADLPAPSPVSALWAQSSFLLMGTQVQPVAADTEAVGQLREIAAQTLLASCRAYERSQEQKTYTEGIQTAVGQIVEKVLGPDYPARVSFPTDAQSSASSLLVVRIDDLNPVVAARATVGRVQMPDNLGGRLTLDDFTRRFGESRLGRRIRADWDRCQDEVSRQLAALLPVGKFPRFFTDKKLSEISAELSRLKGVALVTYDRTPAGDLVFDVVYQPPQGSLTASLNGDSTQELSGSLSFSYGWKNGLQLSAQAELGISSSSSSASAGSSPHSFGQGWQATADLEASYQKNNDVRLGTHSGPLVSLRDADAGGRVVARHDSSDAVQPASRTHAESSLYIHGRWLKGNGPSAFLGSPRSLSAPSASPAAFSMRPSAFLGSPRSLSGPALTLRQQFTFETVPAAAAPSRSPFGRRVYQASAEATYWLPDDHADYASGRANASLRQEFGGAASDDAYLELRGAGGLADQAAPRIDFFRLGADQGLAGLDEGELAGRSFATVALETGYSLGAFLRRRARPADATASSPAPAGSPQASQLDSFYVFVLAEHGCVGLQEDAGGDLNPDTSASSYALGGRYFGIVPGLGSAASVAFGYAWSPESIRESGRFFTRIVIPFGN